MEILCVVVFLMSADDGKSYNDESKGTALLGILYFVVSLY